MLSPFLHCCSLLLLLPLVPQIARAAETQNFIIKTLPSQMRYDVTDLVVKPGAEVRLTFVNQDQMPHNLIFFQAGADAVAVCNKQLEKPDEALKRDWLPEDPGIWLHSKNLDPGAQEVLVFKAPEKTGVYPYVCSMPGHAAIMNGKLRVISAGPQLTNLHFALYLGNWNKLPDFTQLQPHREGPIPDNLVQLKLDDYKNHFGVVYTAKITAPMDGEYTFAVACDDGARVSIDGKKVVEYDGVHPATEVRSQRTKLKAGEHEVRVDYFQAEGGADLFVGWQGPTFSMTPLSKWVPENFDGGRMVKKDETTGLPLLVGTEPIIYRNFIEGGGDRGIGVGYPGGFNLAWSADHLNLTELWRGAFIDAAKHWRGRGGGSQPPLGYQVCHTGGMEGPPFAVLTAPDQEWPKLGRDQRPDGFTWKGYTLDARRFPTFRYEWMGAKITDRFDVSGDGTTPDGRLIRTVKVEGELPANAWFRPAAGSLIKPEGAAFLVDYSSRYFVQADGAQATSQNVLIPARAEMKVVYSWPTTTATTAGNP